MVWLLLCGEVCLQGGVDDVGEPPFEDLWVPTISSTSRDQAIFVDRATDVSLSSYAVLAENDRLW